MRSRGVWVRGGPVGGAWSYPRHDGAHAVPDTGNERSGSRLRDDQGHESRGTAGYGCCSVGRRERLSHPRPHHRLCGARKRAGP